MKTFTHTGALVFVFGFWFMLLGVGLVQSHQALWSGVAVMGLGLVIGSIEAMAAHHKSKVDTKRGRA